MLKPRSHRLNLDLGPKSYEALKQLQTSLETASQAETLRIALQVLQKLVREVEAGGRVVIERSDGDVVQIELPGIMQVTSEAVTSRQLRRVRP